MYVYWSSRICNIWASMIQSYILTIIGDQEDVWMDRLAICLHTQILRYGISLYQVPNWLGGFRLKQRCFMKHEFEILNFRIDGLRDICRVWILDHIQMFGIRIHISSSPPCYWWNTNFPLNNFFLKKYQDSLIFYMNG